jgi:hypothetical protein
VFSYEDRADDLSHFVRGVRRTVTRRLAGVEMHAPLRPDGEPVLVRRYQLEYDTSARTGRSVLRTIRECDDRGVCREPIDLEVMQTVPLVRAGSIATSWDASRVFIGPLVGRAAAISGDFFGEGYELALRTTGGAGWTAVDPRRRSEGGRWDALRFTTPTADEALIPFDFDTDGRSELLRYYVDPGDRSLIRVAVARLRRVDATTAALDTVVGPAGLPELRVGRQGLECRWMPALADIDGDGLTDLLHGCVRTTRDQEGAERVSTSWSFHAAEGSRASRRRSRSPRSTAPRSRSSMPTATAGWTPCSAGRPTGWCVEAPTSRRSGWCPAPSSTRTARLGRIGRSSST